ncbi:MAG: CHAT domain-containing tetratricopeptide repeat protein [Gemmataceae bacterium]
MYRHAGWLILFGVSATWAAAPPVRISPERQRAIDEARQMYARAAEARIAGKPEEALRLYQATLQAQENLYAAMWYPDGHPELANTLNEIGIVAQTMQQFAVAESHNARALIMREKLYPSSRYPEGHPELAQSLNNQAGVYGDQSKYTRAEMLYRQAMEMNERLYPVSRYPEGHPELARSQNNLAWLFYIQGDHGKAEPLYRRALEMREKLYPVSRYPEGHPDLARSLASLAKLYESQAEYAKAEPLYRRAQEMREKLYPGSRFPEGHPDLVISLNNLAALHESQAEFTKAEPLYRRALEMREKLYPPSRYPIGHPDLAQSLNNLAILYSAQAEYEKAEPLYRRALEMREKLYPACRYPMGHSALASSLNNLAGLYESQAKFGKAESLYLRALEMREKLYPASSYPMGHPDLALSLNNLAFVFSAQAEYGKAEPLYCRALEMREKLYPASRYPEGHENLAASLNNLAEVYESQEEYQKAEPLFRRALEMREKLYPASRYPTGHPDLASSLNSLAGLYESQQVYGKAEPLYRRALEMREKLYPASRYPAGHPELAQSLNNLAYLYMARGEYGIAEPLYLRALKMEEKFYPTSVHPQGHPSLAMSLNNLGFLYQAQGEHSRAEPLFRRALAMYTASAVTLARSADEATALNYASEQPQVWYGYLSVTRHLPTINAYPALWLTKSALTRVVEQRHLAALAAESSEARQLWNSETSLRREREGLLLAAMDGDKARARDARLDAIDAELRQLRAKLQPLLPELKRAQEQATRTPADLQKALPPDTAFVDLLRYRQFQQDPNVKGEKGERRIPSYVAFIVTRDKITRVELGEAKILESTLEAWRTALIQGSVAEEKHAAAMYQKLWSPLAKQLPPQVQKLYLSPDAALTRVPWPALLDEQGSRLLERFTLATVPHGPYLLDHLTRPKTKPREKPTLLALGGVSYDEKSAQPTELALRSPASEGVTWKTLPGTRKELEQLIALAGDRRIVRREGNTATVATLLADLPTVETAHLATHGFFADARFRSILQLDPKLFERKGDQRSTAGARSPLVLSGLVCAGANLPDTPNRGIITAEALVGLDLRKMNLAVLSACETGLGETAGGEGVFGLTRAFHVAGCKNVVASLWKVDDQATAALMNLFYRQLWQAKEPLGPAEALRRAQLALLRNPERIPEWAAGRGPALKAEAVELPQEKPVARKVSPARVWAAFLASGLGD